MTEVTQPASSTNGATTTATTRAANTASPMNAHGGENGASSSQIAIKTAQPCHSISANGNGSVRTTTTTLPAAHPAAAIVANGEAVRPVFLPSHGPKEVAVIGAAFSGGQGKAGVELGPRALAEFGLHQQLRDLDWKVHEESRAETLSELNPSNDPDVGVVKRSQYVGKACARVADLVEEHARQGKFVLTIGGDHALAMGTISGSSRVYGDKGLCVVWVDAHADINTPRSTASGNLHGCPVAFLLGLEGSTTDVPALGWVRPCLTPDRIVYIGLRDVDVPEKRILRQLGIKTFSMTDVDRYGIGRVVEMALDHVNPDRDRPIHLSYDVDALDPSVAPATGTPVRGGLTFREGHYINEALCETGLLVAMDLVEVNPTMAMGDMHELTKTVSVGCSLIRAALGETLT